MKKAISIIMLAMMIGASTMHAAEECSVASAPGNPLATVLSSESDSGTICSKAQDLIRGGCSVNSVDGKGNTPLYYASKGGFLPVVQCLLGAGAEVDMDENEGIKGVTALFVAAESGKDKAVSELIKAGANPKIVTEKNNLTPLFIASKNGHNTVVKVLLQNSKTEVDRPTKQKATPLLIASLGGHEGVTEQLIAAGADCNAKSNATRTPLLLAATKGFEPIVRQLVDAGADLTDIYPLERGDEEDNDDYFVGLLWRAIEAGHLDIANILSANGAPVIVPADWESILRSKGQSEEDIGKARALCTQSSPLHKAIENGDMEQAKKWVYCVDSGVKDAKGLRFFEVVGNEEVKNFLLRAYQDRDRLEEITSLEKYLKQGENSSGHSSDESSE